MLMVGISALPSGATNHKSRTRKASCSCRSIHGIGLYRLVRETNEVRLAMGREGTSSGGRCYLRRGLIAAVACCAESSRSGSFSVPSSLRSRPVLRSSGAAAAEGGSGCFGGVGLCLRGEP